MKRVRRERKQIKKVENKAYIEIQENVRTLLVTFMKHGKEVRICTVLTARLCNATSLHNGPLQ